MASKKSYFNFTIFKNNIGRHWPIWTGYLFLLVFTGPFSLFMSNSNHSFVDKRDFLYGLSTVMNICASPVILSIFIVLSAMAVFSYQFNTRSAHAIHALPIAREGLFLTNYVSGLTYLLVPQLINYLLTTLVTLGINPAYTDNLHPWILSCFFVTILLYSTMVMFCMFSGNFFWPAALYIIFNLLYVGVKFLVLGLGHLLLYGVTTQESAYSGKDSLLSPLFHLTGYHTFSPIDLPLHSMEIEVSSTGFYIPYAIATILIIIVAFLLYKYRKIECVGDVLSYKMMRPFFLWLASLCMIGLLTEFFTSFFFNSDVYLNESHFRVVFIFVFAFSFICFYAVEMIIKKRFRIFNKKKVMESFFFTAFVIIALCCIRYDILNLESKIPTTDSIKYVDLDYFYKTQCTSQKEIKFTRELQKQLLAKKNSPVDIATDDIQTISLTYHLKNGHELKRVYPFRVSKADIADSNSISSLTSELFNDFDRIINLLGMDKKEHLSPLNLSVYTPEYYDEKTGEKPAGAVPPSLNQTLDADLILPILESYLDEIKAGHIQAFPTQLTDEEKSHYYSTVISLNYSYAPNDQTSFQDQSSYFNEYSINTSTFSDNYTVNLNVDLHINDQCTKLLELLDANGVQVSKLTFVQPER